MKLRSTILLVMAILPLISTAQDNGPYGYYLEALKFSQTTTGGSARIQALGGSSVALGADISSVSSNPAGLGMYNRSDISFTPGVLFNINKAGLYGSEIKTQKTYGSLDNIGLVINNTHDNVSGWLGGSFGFSVNKINDFDNEFRYSAQNNQTSVMDYFVESANGFSAYDFPSLAQATDLTTLAYYAYLIGPWDVVDPSYPNDEYFSDVTSFLRPELHQEELVKTSGSQYQWSLAYGGNLADVLYLGASLGIVSLNYNIHKSYMESGYDYSAEDPTYDPISQVNLEEDLKINGTGVNATFGLILRPVSFIRLGASVTTPTVYDLTDQYHTSLSANWNNFYYADIVGGDTTLNFVQASSAQVASKYSLSTPLKASFGAAVFLGKLGFITTDIEYLDYRNTFLQSDDFSMDGDNNYIKNNFSEALNIRAGVEIRLDALRLRAGYALDEVPVTADLNYRSSNQRISAGAGLHLENFYGDLTLVNNLVKGNYNPYTLADNSQPDVELKANNFKLLLTLGYKF